MPLADPAFLYVGSDKYTAVAAWATVTVDNAGRLIRPLTLPTAANQRVYVATTGGTTGATEPVWTFTKGAIQPTDGTVVWQECTGQPAVNGDKTNTLDWNSAKTNSVALGQIIKNIAATYYFICTIAGTSGSGAEPSWTLTAGVATVDNTVTWMCIGAVGTFAAFAAPHQQILNADALTWQTVVGSRVYISNAHAETQAAAMTLQGGQGTGANPTKYLCVSNSVAPPTAVTTGATVSTTGANSITFKFFGYYYGIVFQSGSAANAANISINTNFQYNQNHYLTFDNCVLTLSNTNAFSIIAIGAGLNNNTGQLVSALNSCAFKFGATSQSIQFGAGTTRIIGGSAALTGSVPTTLFLGTNDTIFTAIIRDIDLSAVTGTLFSIPNVGYGGNMGSIELDNCKLGAAVTMTSGSEFIGVGGVKFIVANCDSGAKNYRFYEKDGFGVAQSETTIVDNTNTSTDGTTPISWNIATSANTSFYQPYVTDWLPIVEWQNAVGSPVTATVQIASTVTLTNAQIWMEIEYLGNASFPIGSTANNRATDILATPSNVTTSTDTWGGAQTSFQKLQVTFTPAMKGPVKARIFVAIPSTTIYVSPRLLLGAVSSNRQYLIPGAGYINETGSTGGGGSTAYTFVG